MYSYYSDLPDMADGWEVYIFTVTILHTYVKHFIVI